MRVKTILCAATIVAAGIVPNAGFAAATAIATADLNIRTGPGPDYPVIGAIRYNEQATILGCIDGSLWCQVTYGGRQGWAYSRYLTTQVSGNTVILAERRAEVGVPTIRYETTAPGVTTGVAGGAITGALIGGPVGAAAGAITGAALGARIDPPADVDTYVTTNQIDPVYLDGEVVVGAGLPETVELRPVPNYQYRYVYVNRQPVLVEPDTRRIVYVYR